jgi:hypothetical protein|tara:strand:- start:3515 stop:3721 length:207 start_codon:yes stop_codon:yes gene_type:complete
MENQRKPKFYAKKRTKSGRYITIAEGFTRQELIESIKSDSTTYKKDVDVHDHPIGYGFAHKDTKRNRQ